MTASLQCLVQVLHTVDIYSQTSLRRYILSSCYYRINANIVLLGILYRKRKRIGAGE